MRSALDVRAVDVAMLAEVSEPDTLTLKAPMKFISGIILAMALCAPLAAQLRMRRMTDDEQRDIQQAIRSLTVAANHRDAAAAKLVALPSLNVRGAGRMFDVNGLSKWSERRDEDLSKVELATLVRELRLFNDDVAMVDGFFRTTGWPKGDFAGDFSATVVRRDGRWLVSQIRCEPHLNDGTFFAVTPAPRQGTDWVELLAGDSLEAFVSTPGGAPPKSWSVVDGVLTLAGGGGSIRTKQTFRSFEVEWEWKTPAKGNSGLKYHMFYLTRGDAAAYEYQIADDAGDAGAINHPMERSGALYNQIAPSKSMVKPVGEYNRSSIIVRGRHCEHWLNGEKVVEYETESGPLESPLLIQNHGTKIWIRKLRVRNIADQ